MKKLFSLFLAVLMMLSLSMVAFADGEETTAAPEGEPVIEAGKSVITVTDERKYEVYQIFTGDLHESTLSNIKWGQNGTGTVGEAVDKTILDALDGVKSSSDKVKLTEILKYVKTDSTAYGTVDKMNSMTVPNGYYLLKDVTENPTAGFEYSTYLVKIVASLTVNAKTGNVTSDKKVMDTNDSTGKTSGWQDSADYDIGDDVPFQLTGTVSDKYDQYTSYYFCFHDKLSNGLTLNTNSFEVYVGDTKITSGYEVVITDFTDGCSFEVKFTDLKSISSVQAGSTIKVTYTAKLNENAVIGSTGNENTMHLEFSNNPNETTNKGTTPEDKVVVFTYKLIINKLDDNKAALTGAGFTLYKWVKSSEENNGTWTEIGSELKGTDMTTFTWTGLDDGKYKLVESTTPAGYNTMADIEFTITAAHATENAAPTLTSLTADTALSATADLNAGSLTSNIINHKGTILPETGAMGTAIFVAVGTVLATVAVVFLVTRKKMSVYED